MYNCASDVLAYHDDEVTLPQVERTNMRERRDVNRKRLRKGLKDKGEPAPRDFASQGSYAMATMTQHPAKDYDIDDGVYFDKAVLLGERGRARVTRHPRPDAREHPFVAGRRRRDDLSGVSARHRLAVGVLPGRWVGSGSEPERSASTSTTCTAVDAATASEVTPLRTRAVKPACSASACLSRSSRRATS